MNNKDYVIVKDGEMVHFKYIKREKVNGEWRYYYDKGSIGRSIKKAVGIDARNAYKSAQATAAAKANARDEAIKIANQTDANKLAKDASNARLASQREYVKLNAVRSDVDAAIDSIPSMPKPQAITSTEPLQDVKDRYVKATDAAASANKKFTDAQKEADNALSEYRTLKGEVDKMPNPNDRAKKALDAALNKYNSCAKAAEKYEKAAIEAKTAAERAKAEYDVAYREDVYKKDVSAYTNAVKKFTAYNSVAVKQASKASEARSRYEKANKEANDARYDDANASVATTIADKAQKKAEEALKKYYKTPLGSLKFLSDKGKELLYKIF